MDDTPGRVMNLAMGAVLAFIAVVGLYIAITGKATVVSANRAGMKPHTRRIPALVAIVAIAQLAQQR